MSKPGSSTGKPGSESLENFCFDSCKGSLVLLSVVGFLDWRNVPVQGCVAWQVAVAQA